MATRVNLLPESARFPPTNFPQTLQYGSGDNRLYLAYDASTAEAAYWTFIAPQGLTGTLTAIVSFAMASATTGNIILRGYIEAITDGDASPNLASATSFDTANSSATTAVPGTAGLMKQLTITLTNKDSIAAGDLVRFKLDRDAANASDTAAGDCNVLSVEIRDAA